MRTIWKYLIPTEKKIFEIEMPAESEVIAVQVQGDSPYLWAIVDPESKTTQKKFRLVFTGEEFEENLWVWGVHVGTFQLSGGLFVFHLFWQAERTEGG